MNFDQLKTQEARRKAVLSEQKNRCNRCDLIEWLGEPISLELEHKDGDRHNNSRENLECLCPNCHSLTPTWRGRNRTSCRRVSDEMLVSAMRECGTISAALTKLGLAPKGNNYKRAHRLFAQYRLTKTLNYAWQKFMPENVPEATKLRADGLSYAKIAKRFGMSRSALTRALKNAWRTESESNRRIED